MVARLLAALQASRLLGVLSGSLPEDLDSFTSGRAGELSREPEALVKVYDYVLERNLEGKGASEARKALADSVRLAGITLEEGGSALLELVKAYRVLRGLP